MAGNDAAAPRSALAALGNRLAGPAAGAPASKVAKVRPARRAAARPWLVA